MIGFDLFLTGYHKGGIVMRLRHLALGCSLTGALGCLALTPVTAQAALKPKPRLTISAPAQDNRYGSRVKFTVTLSPTAKNRTVSLYASPYGSRARKLVATAKVSPHGAWHPAYPITKKTTFTVVFGGDARNAANSAHVTLQAHARVAERLSGYFKTATIGGANYRVFHGSGTLTLYATVTPARHAQCLEPESEQYDKGAGWGADTKYGCDSVNAAGHDTAPFSLNLAVGDRYRIRATYFRDAKYLANLSQHGPWLYFKVVK